MNSKQVLGGFVLATSFALTTLAGCNVPGAAGAAGNGGATPGAQQSGGQMNNEGSSQTSAPAPGAARDGAAEALAEEREMGDLDAVAWDDAAAAYAVSMVGQPEPHKPIKHAFKGKLKAEAHVNLKERMRERAMKAHERHKGHSHKVRDAAKGAQWVDNGDGTESRTFMSDVSKTVNGKTMSRKLEIKHRRHIETKHLIESHSKLETTLPNGASRTSERTKTLSGEDGSYALTFGSTLTLKNGATRVAAWDHAIAADGSVTGTGTISWFKRAGTAVNMAVAVAMKGTEVAAKADVGGEIVDADAPEAADEGTDATADAWGVASDSDQESEEDSGDDSAEDESEEPADA